MNPYNQKAKAGALGGQATLARHGPEHFRQIGRRGAAATWARYELRPLGAADFAMVDKTTGQVKARLSGRAIF